MIVSIANRPGVLITTNIALTREVRQ